MGLEVMGVSVDRASDVPQAVGKFVGKVDTYSKDTLLVDNNIVCLMENLDSTDYDSMIGKTITIKGRVLGYNRATKKMRLDRCFIQK